jgi:sulfate permease, SulP family
MNTRWLPPTLQGFRRSWLSSDILAGLTLVAVAVPSQMATAHLANLPVVTGLYAFVAGSLLYAIIGKSPHLSVGADSTIAPVLAVGAASVAVVGSAGYTSAVAIATLLVGGVLLAIGLCRLGWIAEFLSTPVITGVLAGIAVEIMVRQLPTILGVTDTGTTTIGTIRQVFDHWRHTNLWAVGIACIVLVIIVGASRINVRLPGALLAVVLSIVAVDAFGLAAHHGVAVIGAIRGGVRHPRLPSPTWSELRRLVPTVLTVAFLCVAQTAATIRISGSVSSSTPRDFNRDLIGVGAGSVVAGFFGAPAVDASPPNTAITRESGSRSQLTNLMAAAVVVCVVLFLMGPLAKLPLAALAGTLVFVAAKLLRVGDLKRILRFDPIEFGLAAVTLCVVAVVGIEQGVLVAMFLSLADRTRRNFRPRDSVLGREPGTDHWMPVDVGLPTEQIPGVIVYLVYAGLWYGNADFVRSRILELVDNASEPVKTVVFDADAVSDIDYTGLQALKGLIGELNGRNVTFGIARASHLVHHELKHGALLEKIGADHLYGSVDAAVDALGPSGAAPQ